MAPRLLMCLLGGLIGFGPILGHAEPPPVQVVMAQTPGVELSLFGGLKTYPHFVHDIDFNDRDTPLDFLIDESGMIDHDDVTVRNEFRLGIKGVGTGWQFSAILEADFDLDKNNTDRGVRDDGSLDGAGELQGLGMTGEDFGVEKLDFRYDFANHGAPMVLSTGWDTNFLDLETGAVLYGDDHPYIALAGHLGQAAWKAMTLFIFDDVRPGIGADLDWRAYTLRLEVPVHGLRWVPFYAFSDNKARRADVHYLGIETFGKIGRLTPRAEWVYALGNKDHDVDDASTAIRAHAGYVSLELALTPLLQPYLGGYYLSGDDDGGDDTIRAFNPITNAARFTPTFGMENAFIYRFVPALGTHLYSNAPDNLGTRNSGYGGIGNTSTADSPGLATLGLGIKGGQAAFAYRAQYQQMWLAATGALAHSLADSLGKTQIAQRLGGEFDLQLTYRFSAHFSLGNTLSLFTPGPAIEDIRGPDFDRMAILDTVEMTWRF